MKYEFTMEQLNSLVQTLDIYIKQFGLQKVYQTAELFHTIQSQVNGETEGDKAVELSEQQVKEFVEVFDTAVKTVGLQGAYGILALAEILKNPLAEEKALDDKVE